MAAYYFSAADAAGHDAKDEGMEDSLMRICVAGAMVFDETVLPDGSSVESFGGIVYNMAALSAIGGGELEIVPISNVGDDRWNQIAELTVSMPGVQTDGLTKILDGKLTHAQLVYRDENYRDEYVRFMMPELSGSDFRAVGSYDAVVVNFVNGTEMTLDTVAELRASTDAFMHLDMHNVMVRFMDDGEKTFLDFSDWPEWVSHFDAVQMNEFEAEKVLGREVSSIEEFTVAAKEVLDAGPQVVLMTLGPQGVVVAHRQDGSDYHCHIRAAPIAKLVDTTGSGDAFSAGFVWNTLNGAEPLTSAMSAAVVAAVNCQTPGIGPLAQARDASSRVADIWPELSSQVENGWPGEPY